MSSEHIDPLEQYNKGFLPPLQDQSRIPGRQRLLNPPPIDDITCDRKPYKPAGKLEGLSVVVTGADSGIGRAVAILFALEGADLTLQYLPQEEEDAKDVEKIIEEKTNGARKIQFVAINLREEANCQELIKQHVDFHGKLDSLVLNHGTQQSNDDLTTLSTEQWHTVFDTNIHSFFYLCKAALPHMPQGSTITFNASINPSVGHPKLVDYTATKGAIVGLMRALSNQIVGERGIRVNAVAPGPIWTPLIPATMSKDSKESFGVSTPMGRPGQPVEVATCFVFLSSADSGYISGQIIHVNGGTVIA